MYTRLYYYDKELDAMKMMTQLPSDPAHAMAGNEDDTARHQDGPAALVFDLPNDLLDLLIKPFRGYLTVATALNLARTCKLAASIVLPRLYSSAPLWSIRALPSLYTSLVTCPERASHVRAVIAATDLMFVPDQYDCVSAALCNSKVAPGSSLMSTDAALARCGPDALQALPMLWLSRIAAVCPNLITVDLTACSPRFIPASFMFGFLNLVAVLRERGGRFIVPGRALPLAVVLVDEPGTATMDSASGGLPLRPMLAVMPNVIPYGIVSMDWGRKEMGITDGMLDTVGPGFMVPLCDLISTDRGEQARWRIKDVNCGSVAVGLAGIGGMAPQEGPMAKTEQEAWQVYGVRMDEDHIFKLDEHIGRDSEVIVWSMSLDSAEAWMRGHGIKAATMCKSVAIRGVIPDRVSFLDAPESQSQLTSMIAALHRLPSQPWTALQSLMFTNGVVFNRDNVHSIVGALAAGAPNLVALRIHNLVLTLDVMLHALDVLLRRPVNPLNLLSIMCGYDPLSPDAAHGVNTYPAPLDLANLDPGRSPLNMKRAATGNLRSLSLIFIGHGPYGLSDVLPTLLIHPGLLHGVRDLTLSGVRLAISPPAFAHPTSPSFLPAGILTNLAQAKGATPPPPLCFAYVTLPGLWRMEVNINCLLSGTACDPAFLFPKAPNLVTLVYMDVPMAIALSARAILNLLARYPKVRTVQIAKVQVSRADVENVLVPTLFAPWPPEMRPNPQLRELVIANLGNHDDGGMVGNLVYGAHVLDMMARESEYVPLVKSSAETVSVGAEDASVRLLEGEKTCGTCGLVVAPRQPRKDPESLADMRAVLLAHGLRPARGRAMPRDNVPQVDVEDRCVRCAQARRVRFYDARTSAEQMWLVR